MAENTFAEVLFFARAFQLSRLVQVAAELELADRLGDEPRPIDELAAEAGAHPEKLLRLCRTLAAFGIFTVNDDDRLGQTPRSAYLRKDSVPTLHYAARFWGLPMSWETWGGIGDTIRTGEAAFEAIFGMPNFDYLRLHPEEAQIFDAFMQHSPDDRHAAVAEAYDFAGVDLVVDIGGGNGGLLQAILGTHAGVRGMLFDQEAVVAGAAALAGIADRCAIAAGSFFERVPSGGDIYTLSQILHDWSDERCHVILGNCRAAMGPDARLLVIERVLGHGDAASAPMAFLTDMQMMATFPGAKERTLGEYNRLFADVRLSEGRVIPTRSAFSIIETMPA